MDERATSANQANGQSIFAPSQANERTARRAANVVFSKNTRSGRR
jgi:hypothetical protein